MGRIPLKLLPAGLLVGALAVFAAPVARAGDGAWSQPAASPTSYQTEGVTFDTHRNLLYVYTTHENSDRIFAFGPSAQSWRTIVPEGTPPSDFSGVMIYDAANDRLVLMGLPVSGTDHPIYTVNLIGTPTWHVESPPDGPALRRDPAAIYDPVNQQMVIFGGEHADEPYEFGDAWALTLGSGGMQWISISPWGPAEYRQRMQAVYDPVGQRMVIHGGSYLNTSPLHDVWALSLDASHEWTQLADDGPALTGAASAYDAAHHRMLVFGGLGTCCGPGSPGSAKQDTWQFDFETNQWTSLSTVSPPGARSNVEGAIDADGRFVVFGGLVLGVGDVNDVYSLDTAGTPTWSPLFLEDQNRIDGRRDVVLAWDPVRNRALVAGGTTPNGVANETWAFDPGTQRLAKLTTTSTGGANSLRSGAAGFWDPLRNRLVVFGGLNGAPSHDVIALDGATSAWGPVTAFQNPAPPSDRKFAAGAYDAARDRALFFAGYPVTNAHNEVWSLSLANSPSPVSWSLLTPGGAAPTQRWGHTFTADAGHDRMILFGGGDGTVSNDLYVLSLAGAGTWTKLTGPGTPPPARSFHGAIFDPVNDRLIVWGGQGAGGTYLGDTWEYRFDGGGGWRQMSPAGQPPAGTAMAVYEPGLHRMLLFGSETASGLVPETWQLDLVGQTTGVPDGPVASAAFALQGATPNPSFAAPRIAFTLPDGSPAKLELIDLAGRRVRAADVGVLGAGRHLVDLGSSGAIAPGLYFARLSRGGEVKVARVCVVK